MKQLNINGGFSILIDDEDLELVSQYKWTLNNKHVRLSSNKGVFLPIHVVIFEKHRIVYRGECHHKNGNPLDNRKENLVSCTKSEHRHMEAGRSWTGYKGVTAKRNKWQARIYDKGRLIVLGCFNTPEEAALAYDKKATEIFGNHAFINFPRNV